MLLAKIHVMLKPGVLDPQGTAVQKALHAMEFPGVQDVRIGKYMEIKLQADSKAEGERQVQEMCRRLLANPVIERFEFQVAEV